jgi:hypothetical protein
MNHSNPSPLRLRFIDYLTLHRKAERTVHAYVSFIFDLARFHHRRPDRLGPPELERWLAHLIGKRKLYASSVNTCLPGRPDDGRAQNPAQFLRRPLSLDISHVSDGLINTVASARWPRHHRRGELFQQFGRAGGSR